MITVEVTSRDIAAGIRGSAASCPVALAVSRVLKQDSVFITRFSIDVLDGDGWIADYQCPEAVWAFVQQFDAGKSVQPLTFTLDLNRGESSGGLR